ncbi:hypothetical protein LG3211_4846 [Lysobacter gummosus]|nr:hypothetical protein LG3211_4846 [Lysobacter gummosus]
MQRYWRVSRRQTFAVSGDSASSITMVTAPMMVVSRAGYV